MSNLDEVLVLESTPFLQLLKQLDGTSSSEIPAGILIVVNSQEVMVGTITDGDIRRAILKGDFLNLTAKQIMNTDPISFSDHLTAQQILENLSVELEKRNRKSKRFLSKIILVDEQRRPTRILDYHSLWEQRVAIHRHLCVIGLGYVGLTLALVLADEGYKVTGVDTDSSRLEQLKKGKSYIHENGLPELLREQIGVNFNVEQELPSEADVYIVSVGTPVELVDGVKRPSMRFLQMAVEGIAKVLKQGDLVILRSTVPVSTCRTFVKEQLENLTDLRCGLDFHLSFAPERTAEGKALKELRSLPQIIGGYNDDSLEATAAIFREITPTLVKVESLEAAEMAKLINNSFRDYVFGFANQISKIASQFNINIFDVIRAANEGYPRDTVPFPSPGVGGPCLTKDPYIFAHVAENVSLEGDIFTQSREINISMHDHVVESVMQQLIALGKDPQKCKVLVCGLAFKGNPETGDLRDSSSVTIAESFVGKVESVYGYDAVATREDIQAIGLKPLSIPEGFKGIDAVLFLNNHREFLKIDTFEMVRVMNEKAIVYDGWNLFRKEEILNAKPSVYMGLSFTATSIQ